MAIFARSQDGQSLSSPPASIRIGPFAFSTLNAAASRAAGVAFASASRKTGVSAGAFAPLGVVH
jgi:hypothetical protein